MIGLWETIYGGCCLLICADNDLIICVLVEERKARRMEGSSNVYGMSIYEENVLQRLNVLEV